MKIKWFATALQSAILGILLYHKVYYVAAALVYFGLRMGLHSKE